MRLTIRPLRSKLALSKLVSQSEAIQHDLDVRDLALRHHGLVPFAIGEAVVDGDVTRTIEGASLLTIQVNDSKGTLRNSGRLARGADVNIDGLWFRLTDVDKQANDVLLLTFEDREINILRTYNRVKTAIWGITSRAWFVWSMLQEVVEYKPKGIPYQIEGLKKIADAPDPISAALDAAGKNRAKGDKVPGLPYPNNLTVKTDKMTQAQLLVANDILDAGSAMLVRRKLMVCAIMTAIQENNLGTSPANGTHVGAFQQDSSPDSIWVKDGGGTGTDVKADAHAFYTEAVKIDTRPNSTSGGRLNWGGPSLAYWQLCEAVQGSGLGTLYNAWRLQAERIVTEYGIGGDPSGTDFVTGQKDTSGDLGDFSLSPDASSQIDYQFMRGTPSKNAAGRRIWKKEDTWTCISRLADEIQIRAFFISGKFYFISDKTLYKAQPLATITQETDGIDDITWSLSELRAFATLTVAVHLHRWDAPPGSVVIVSGQGPVDGRWLVTTVQRPIFSQQGTITLKKPIKQLPEPTKSGLIQDWGIKGGKGGGNAAPGTPYAPPFTGKTGAIPQGKNAKAFALKLKPYIAEGLLSDHPDLDATMRGEPVRNGFGDMVYIDERIPQLLLWLLQAGHSLTIGAICSDHSGTTTTGNISAHTAGKAIDIASYDGKNVAVKDVSVKAKVIELLKILNNATAPLYPAQLISGGYGNSYEAGYDKDCQALCIPNAAQYAGITSTGHTTLGEHTNHVHVGY